MAFNKTNWAAWKVFLILTAANAVISFAPIPLWFKVLIGSLFIAGPLLFLGRSKHLQPLLVQSILKMEAIPNPSREIWILIVLLGPFSRFWGLTTLSDWPTMDEGWIGLLALRLSEKWDWNLLLSRFQIPPLHFWGQALFFQWLGPSLFSLWFFPACLSILTLVLGYWAARQYFSKSFSFLCLVWGIINYWLLWSGRFSAPPCDMALPFECLVLGILGLLLKALKKQNLGARPLILGISTGLCAYASTVSILMVVPMVFTAAWIGWENPWARKKIWLGFFSGLLVAVPLIFSALIHGYGRYHESLWFLNPSGYYENLWMAPLSHITGIYWGARDWTLWGGLLNPLEASLVFLGLVFAVKAGLPLTRWLLAAFAFFNLPGLLTNSYEPFREILVAPLLLVFAAMGLGWLLAGIGGPTRRVVMAGALMVLCAGLNLYHLWGPYHEAWGHQGPVCSRFKAMEAWRAFDQLKELQSKEGPGIILADFSPKIGAAVDIAAYPFNADENPRTPREKAKWFAVCVNAHFVPVLKGSFSESRLFWLSEHMDLTDGGLELGVFPLNEKNRPQVEKWRKANGLLREALWETTSRSHPDPEGSALQLLRDHTPDFQGDPFLEMVVRERVKELEVGRFP